MTEPLINEEDTDVDDEGREAGASAEHEPGAHDAREDEGVPEGQGVPEDDDVPEDEYAPEDEDEDVAEDARRSLRSDGKGDRAPGQDVETELVALRAEFDGLNDRHLRLVAEFNNFRRRSEQERLSAWSRAQADLVGKFLDVLDDLQRVAHLDLSNATVETIMEGIDLVERKFVRMLEDAGAEMIDPADEPFDPELMEAMMRVPAKDDEQVDTVAQVFQKGYSLKGILVRPARVSVYTQG